MVSIVAKTESKFFEIPKMKKDIENKREIESLNDDFDKHRIEILR